MAKSRWAGLALGFAGLLLFSAECAAAPALIVEVKCKPGMAAQWQADFDKEIAPAIDEVVAKGEGFDKFFYLEAALPGQNFDFLLVFEAKSFAGLDAKRPFPHYLALYRRAGPEHAKQVLDEMASWEADVHVSLGRTHNP
jgi:hypothetical protein